MLTPAKTDENRRAELERRKQDPTAFGTAELDRKPRDWSADNGVLVDVERKRKGGNVRRVLEAAGNGKTEGDQTGQTGDDPK